MYEAALEALNEAHRHYLKVSAEARKRGGVLHPAPEVVGIAHADETIRYWIRPGDKSSDDHFRRRLSGQLGDSLTIAQGHFGVGSHERLVSVVGLRWHAYNEPKGGWSGYIERAGDAATGGPEDVVAWLAADGEIVAPAGPGFPPAGEAPPAGMEI